MAVPVPTTLRITDAHEGKTTPPVGKSRAFQLTTEEVRTNRDVVTCMFSIYYSLLLLYMLMFHIVVFRDVHGEWVACFGSF